MSDYLTMDETINEFESKLSLVVRKPQEGKTYICITNITNDKTHNIHIVLTMNTLSAGMQFFGRMKETIAPENIIVFNSNRETAGICRYAKTIGDVFKLLKNNPGIKVIVCCAHENRIRNSIPDLLEYASDSTTLANRKFIIHIDEAHKYIPENKPQIRIFNASSEVESIIGYSGSPDGIWSKNEADPLFHKILIRDVEKELAIIRSPEYFGVSRCEFIISEEETTIEEIIKTTNISSNIPKSVVKLSEMNKEKNDNFFSDSFRFDLGNEILLFSYIDYILPTLSIDNNSFSYNFVPSYNRKVTHYNITSYILKYYTNANVIVMNGKGTELFRLKKNGNIIRKITAKQLLQLAKNTNTEEYNKLLEPSYMIQQMIKDNLNCPTFVTGFTCVGMSVTFINETIGNFDNVIMAHEHYSRDKLYQLCRFLFNYMTWSVEGKSRIKTTKFYSLTKKVVDTCLDYEENVERMCSDFAGKTCSISEILGLEPEQKTEREIKKEALTSIKPINENGKIWKKFKVYDDNDDEMWEKAGKFYKDLMGKNFSARTKPKYVDGYWHCSTTSNVLKQSVRSLSRLEKQSWYSTFQLKADCFIYSRIFVGYENLEVPSDYTIYIKHVVLEDNAKNREILKKYSKRNEKTDDTSSVSSVDSIDVTSEEDN
jgi:hypothetical protein